MYHYVTMDCNLLQGPGIFQKHQRKTSLRHMVLRSNSSTMTTATQLSVRNSLAGWEWHLGCTAKMQHESPQIQA